jgi:hypothetical protein
MQDGGKSAVFECVKTPPRLVMVAPASTYLTVSYQTDQQLLDASRNARAYCMNNGMRGLTTNITQNAYGGSTAAFQCSPG